MSHKREQESILFLLGKVCSEQRRRRIAHLSKIGLYAGQEMFLWQLWCEDGLTQSQMAERMCVQPPTISKMLDRMERAGLVTRNPDPVDTRISHVYLTGKGRNLRQAVSDVWTSLEEQITEGLSIEERLLLRRLLMQVHANLTENPQSVR